MADGPGTDDRAGAVALTRSSPGYVARHDRAGWRGIFGRGFVIEDPVGWTPVDAAGFDRFWDTFIAPNEIRFEVHRDWADGLVVVRDVTIHVTLRPGIEIRTPAILRYESARVDGELRVVRMAAHWESFPVFAQLLRPSPGHLAALTAMGLRMLRRLGLRQTMALAWAARPAGRRTKKRLAAALGLDRVDKLIASGGRVAACGTRDGGPVAVLASLQSGQATDITPYVDLV